MFSQIKGLESTYRPNRGTLTKVKNHPYTQVAGTVLSTTASATAQVASVTVVPAAIAGASYIQQQLDPHGRYDAQVDQLITAAGHGIGVLANSKAITAVKEALTPDPNDPSLIGYVGVPCDVERVEMFDADDLLAFPIRNSDILHTYGKKGESPYAKSDDGIEDGLENISLYTTKEIEQKQDGRLTVKDGALCGDGWELIEEEDQCDSETEEFQQERLADSLAQDGCQELAVNEGRGRVEEGHRRGFEDSSQLSHEEEEQMSQSQIEEQKEDDRLFLEIQWIKHEQTRAERGEETRALGDMLGNGNFLPSSKFMLADMGAGKKDRKMELKKERAKYAQHDGREEVAAGQNNGITGEGEVAAGQDEITVGTDEITHEDEAADIPVSSEELLDEYEAQTTADSFKLTSPTLDFSTSPEEEVSVSAPIDIPGRADQDYPEYSDDNEDEGAKIYGFYHEDKTPVGGDMGYFEGDEDEEEEAWMPRI